MCRVSRHMGSHLIIKILMFVYPCFCELVTDEEREKSHKSLVL